MDRGMMYSMLHAFTQLKESDMAFSLWNGEEVRDVSYPVFLNDILHAAGYFRMKNMQGEHVVLCADNSYDWLVVFMAVLASGNVAVLLNPALPEETLMEQSRLADATYLWTDRDFDLHLPTLSYADMIAAEAMPVDETAHHAQDDTVVLLGTSGTTGKSKIVEITSGNLQGSLENSSRLSSVPDMARCFLVLPLYHIGGAITALMIFDQKQTLCVGRGMRYLLADMPALNPTYASLVPAMTETLERIFRNTADPEKRARFIGHRLSRVHIGGAAPKASTCRYFASQGITIDTGYGMTETCGDGTWCELEESLIGTIGKPRGKMQCRIVDGELMFKGASVMKGYYKDPEETAKVITDGWLHTGDMGRVDENGYFFVTGRKKNVIILSNGENVNPEEIETALGKCPDILECLVYGDEKGIRADVYTENEEAARQFIRQYNVTVPMYRQVYKVECQTEPLEKTPTGKIKRKENKL